MVAPVIHIVLHFLVPGAVAGVFFRRRWRMAWLIMVATMVVDVDHVLADPVYDANRCGIGFHPLHTWPAVGAYALATVIPGLRLVGLGLLIHMGLDGLDCLRM